MKTLVFQSFRPTGIPGWIQSCMNSAEAWAKEQGYSYLRLDDAFFEMIPDWFREKSSKSRLPMTDLARLQWIAKFLQGEWERVIWFDADVLVFNPRALRIECRAPEMFALEVWIRTNSASQIVHKVGVNNCAMSFTRSSYFLPFYIESCLRVAQVLEGPIPRSRIGPGLLRHVHQGARFELIRNVAMFSPLVVREIVGDERQLIQLHARHWQGEVHAANLCSSMNMGESYNREDRLNMMEKAVQILLETKGSIVNPELEESTNPQANTL